MNWQAVFFDFDGVIVDSASIKTAAFAEMFRPFGEAVEKAVVAYHLMHQGISRSEKFRYFYEHILHKTLDERNLVKLGNDFSKLVLEAVINAPYIPGAMETLVELKTLNIPAYVVSGTPEEEIRYIVQKKGLSQFFIGVHGSPTTKDYLIEQIIKKNNYQHTDCLFIGDAMTDYIAAKRSRVRFLAISTGQLTQVFPDDTKVFSFVKIPTRE